MLSLPNEIADVLAPLQGVFAQQRSWQKAQTMLVGAILCQGNRTVSRALPVMGLGQAQQYAKYDRMLKRAYRSSLDWAIAIVRMVNRWLNRSWVCVGDSKAATTRTTPVLFALFSWVCLMANRLHALTPLVPHATAW